MVQCGFVTHHWVIFKRFAFLHLKVYKRTKPFLLVWDYWNMDFVINLLYFYCRILWTCFFFTNDFLRDQFNWITDMNLSSVSLLTCCIIPAELARRSPVDTRSLADSFRTKRTGSVQVYTLNTSWHPESRVATESSRPMPSIGQLK